MSLRRFEFAWLPLLAALLCVTPSFASDSANSTSPASASVSKTARACASDLCRFQNLQKALDLDPRNVEALRSLGEYYLGRDQYAAAREKFATAVSVDATDWRSRKSLADLDLREGNLRSAISEYRRLELEQPGNAELSADLATSYERLGYVTDAQRLAMNALRLKPRDQNVQMLVLRIVRRQRDGRALAKVYHAIFAADPADTAAAVREAELLKQDGAIQEAQAVIDRALALHPQDASLQRARQSLLANANSQPTLSGENAELHRDWLAGTLNTADPDASYLADVPEMLRTRPTDLSNSDAMYLADVRVDRVGPTGLATSHVQQLIELGSDAGARRYSSRSIQYSPSTETFSLIRARLHKPDGRVLQGEDAGDERVADRASAMYYDVRSRTVRFASAEPGDVVELEYRITPATTANPYGNYFASMQTFRGTLPTKLKRYVVVADAHRQLYVTGQSMPRLEKAVSQGEQIYRWDAAELAALPSEPLGPPSTELAPYVHVSTLRDFNELGHWYESMLAPQLALNAELEQQALEISTQYKDPLDRVRAVYRFVLTSTHYVALEFGIYSYKPYPVADVYARRFGDCKDKASLMVAMLRAVGVPADFVLVRTRPLGTTVPNAASIALFNHAIAYVPQFDLWLDGTADYYGLRELPLDDQGAMALTVDVLGNAQLRTIPITRPLDNLTARTVQAQISPNGVIDFTGTSTTRGEDAPALRRDFEVQERQRESMRRGLSELFPTVKLDAVNVENADSDHPVQVRFAGTLDVFQGQHTLDLRTTWMQRDYLQRLALLSSRTQDVQLGSPWTTDEEFHFRLPAGAEVSHLPPDTNLRTAFGAATIHYALVNRELVIRSQVQFTRTRIETKEYAQFRDFCASLEQAFRREIKVVLR